MPKEPEPDCEMIGLNEYLDPGSSEGCRGTFKAWVWKVIIFEVVLGKEEKDLAHDQPWSEVA